MSISRIKISGKTNYEKGKSFEKLMMILLDKLDYTNIITRTVRPGMEIDIEANHKTENIHLICQCKAHTEPIQARPLRIFFSDYNYEQRPEHKHLQGKFFSISGFTGEAQSWYNGLSPERKNDFEIYDLEGILKLLIRSKLLLTDKDFDIIIRKNSDLPLGERYVLFFNSNLYLIQILNLSGEPYRFVVLTGSGELPNKVIRGSIIESDMLLKSLHPIDPAILDKVLINLLDVNQKSASQISREVVETIGDVLYALQELEEMGLCSSSEQQGESQKRFLINTNLDALQKMVGKMLNNEFTNRKDKYAFMSSSYVEIATKDDFFAYIESRFKLRLDENQKTVISKLARYFPSALNFMIFGHTTNYGEGNESFRFQDNFRQFIKDTIIGIIGDLHEVTKTFIEKREIAAYLIKNHLRVALKDRLLIELDSEGTYMILTAAGRIEPGQYVMYADESSPLYTGNVLFILKEYIPSIKEYERIITQSRNPELLKAAWCNKGLCLEHISNCEEAIKCFDEALFYDPNLLQAKQGKTRCLDKIPKRG